MSKQRQNRKDRGAEHQDPINFTCGICKQVHRFNVEMPYQCVLIDTTKESDGDGS